MVRCVAIVAAAVGGVWLCGLTHAQGSASGSATGSSFSSCLGGRTNEPLNQKEEQKMAKANGRLAALDALAGDLQ